MPMCTPGTQTTVAVQSLHSEVKGSTLLCE